MPIKNKTKRVKIVVHKMDIAIQIRDQQDIEDLKRLYNVKETKEKQGEKYRVVVYREEKGESLAVYYYSDKTIARVITHKLSRREYVLDYARKFELPVLRDYIELYIRVKEKSEYALFNVLIAYTEIHGIGYFTRIVSREWKRLVYITRTDKHEIAPGLMAVVKLYRDKLLKEQPKIEIAIFTRRPLTKEDIEHAGKILLTIFAVGKAKETYNEYDNNQDKIEINGVDQHLYRALYITHKRIAMSTTLNQYIKDKRIAIAILLDRGLRPVDIARAFGISYDTVKNIIVDLLNMGIIERINRGKYKMVIPYARKLEEQEQLTPLSKIINIEIEDIVIEHLPRGISREEAIKYILQKYPNAQEHPESRKLRAYPPIFYIKQDNKTIYIRPVTKYP